MIQLELNHGHGMELKTCSSQEGSACKMDGGSSMKLVLTLENGLKLTSQLTTDATLTTNAYQFQTQMEARQKDAAVLTQIPTIEDAWLKILIKQKLKLVDKNSFQLAP